MLTGKDLNKKYEINAKHALYREDGTFYHTLKDFPGVLFDKGGHVIYETEKEYREAGLVIYDSCQRVNIKNGISALPNYIKHPFTEDISDDEFDEIEEDISEIEKSTIPETEKKQLIKARRGQGDFRRKLISLDKKDHITGVEDPGLLIASHIQPWVDSSNNERLDGENGLLLPPHIDKLFDTYRISFLDNGKIEVYDTSIFKILEKNWNIDLSKTYYKFSEKRKKYLKYHRDICEKKYR
jgi:hypothetical protein